MHRDMVSDREGNAIDIVLERLAQRGDTPAMYWNGRTISYRAFLALVTAWEARLATDGVGQGTVCGALADYSPGTAALFFALFKRKAIVVPFTTAARAEMTTQLAIAGVTSLYRMAPDDTWTLELLDGKDNALVSTFRERSSPGLIVFTSGSTGVPKGILHDCERVMRKFLAPRDSWSTVLFLMLDHFGGFNTLLSTFAYGGVAVCLPDRAPDTVCRIIAESKATLLPTTPTFLNLLVASGAYQAHDLSSIRLITYGTEVMPEETLARIRAAFPNAVLKQTYGLSELGVLRSKSRADDSVWVRVGGDGFEVKVLDNMLWVRSEANMVGYLNAPSPFSDDGWLCTGDMVETDGDYFRILGRQSDMINVGGQKVFPAEVESVLLQDPNVAEASVAGVPHALMGHVVTARISLVQPEEVGPLTIRLRKLCLAHLTKYKVPVRFVVTDANAQHSERFKKVRSV